MKTYAVKFSRGAQKELKKLASDVQKRILRSVVSLAANPRKGNVRPMVGSTSWRLRVGDYRIIYDINDREVVVLIVKIAHRREVYRNS